jgi:hypothetical protein
MTSFAPAVALTRREVFDVLEACARAERTLLRGGHAAEAAALAAAFELLEDRVMLDPLPPCAPMREAAHGKTRYPADSTAPDASGPFGSKSRDREFTQ